MLLPPWHEASLQCQVVDIFPQMSFEKLTVQAPASGTPPSHTTPASPEPPSPAGGTGRFDFERPE